MQDGWDHPEIWPLLKDVVVSGQHEGILRLLRQLRPVQQPSVLRIFDLVEAVITSLAEDETTMLDRLEARDGLCPQIAGALFYVSHVKNPLRPPNLEGKFCAAPFERIETLVDGMVAPCCSVWTKKRLGPGRHPKRREDLEWNARPGDAREHSGP